MKISYQMLIGSMALTLVLAGCGGSDTATDTPDTTDQATSSTSGVEPAVLDLSSETDGPLTIKVFKGGYGDDFFIEAGEEYGEEFGIEVVTEGDPRMWDRLRPDFVAGNPPDVAWPGWGMDYWALVFDDQIEPMDSYLAMKPYDSDEGTWRDTFDEQLLKLGQFDGKQYMMPYHVNLNGWWYHKTMFEENGWTPPSTFEELLELGEKMKAKGIAPLTFQGQYPYYMLYGFIYPWTISSGGIEAWNDCQNLVPGAWKSEHILKGRSVSRDLERPWILPFRLPFDEPHSI